MNKKLLEVLTQIKNKYFSFDSFKKVDKPKKVYKLSEICSIYFVNSSSPKNLNYLKNIKVAKYIDCGDLFVDDISSKKNDLNILKCPVLKKGTLLVKKSINSDETSRYRVAINKDYDNVIFPFEVYEISPKSSKLVNKYWLFFYMLSKEDEWSKIETIDKQDLGNLKVLLPSMEEQINITSNLLKFVNSVKLWEEQLSLRDQRYLYYLNSLIDDGAKDGRKIYLKDALMFSKFSRWVKKSDALYPYSNKNISIIEDKNICEGQIKEMPFDRKRAKIDPELRCRYVRYGEMVMVISGSNMGEVGINLNYKKYLLGKTLCKIKPRKGLSISSKYLYYLLSLHSKKAAKEFIEEGRDDIKNLNLFLNNWQLSIPTMQFQKNAVKLLDLLFEISSASIKGNEISQLLKDRYKYYLKLWMSGKETK